MPKLPQHEVRQNGRGWECTECDWHGPANMATEHAVMNQYDVKVVAKDDRTVYVDDKGHVLRAPAAHCHECGSMKQGRPQASRPMVEQR